VTVPRGISLNVLLQGGPPKVKPTYIFAGNVWYLNVLDKIQWFFGKCDNSLARHAPWEAQKFNI